MELQDLLRLSREKVKVREQIKQWQEIEKNAHFCRKLKQELRTSTPIGIRGLDYENDD